MNKSQVLHYLRSAYSQLNEMITEIEVDQEDDGFPQFYALLPFVYRDLNRAWNKRDLNFQVESTLTESERENLCRFPEELAPLVSNRSWT